jgi:endothelin-converting enzyme/putative endopeptidase
MKTRRILAAVCLLAPLAAAPAAAAGPDRPLAALPQTPSLDVASMDRSADPCADFYRYSCGGWIERNPIPADKASWSQYGKLYQENQAYLWGLLETAAEPVAGRAAAETQLGDYFAACMDEPAVDAAGAQPIAGDLAAIAALDSKAGLPALVARLHLGIAGGGMMFGFGSAQDYGDASEVIAEARAGGLGLPDRDDYLDADDRSREVRQRYVEHVAAMLALLGRPAPQAAADAHSVMAIETALAAASLTRVERRDPAKVYHRMSPAELQRLTPSFDWSAYLAAAGIAGIDAVNVQQPDFYRALETQLAGKSLEDWKTYLRWHLVDAAAPYLSAPFVAADFEFGSRFLRGVTEMEPRWQRCVGLADRDLGEALGRLFVERTFSPETKAEVETMVHHIEAAMAERLAGLDWMSPATQRQARAKLDAMRNKIGYPARWRDYGAIEIRRDDFFGDVVRARTFESRRQLAKIGQPVDRDEWGMTPPTVNAYYDPSMNDMNFPAGVLQPPLYDPRSDAAPNYGDTGGTIGHELIHGFDDEGSRFDAAGNLRDWWTPEDRAAFEERAQCVADQYAGYTVVDDLKINSELTLGEDLADLGGTILAYAAWKRATAGEDLQPRDGLTPDQRFFVGFAQWACGDERPETKRLRARTNPHSPGEYRINGVVANMPEFARAFECRPGQPMVRENVCRIW